MYQILTDSCCDLPYTLLDEIKVDFISMYVEVNGTEMADDLGRNFKIDEFYQKIKDGAMPTTSQVNVGRYVEFFRSYAEKKIPVLYICFSSGLSGSYHSAMQAVEILKEDLPEAEVLVVDSLAASGGEGLMVYEAAQKQQAGMSLQELYEWLEENKLTYHHWVTVDDLHHLQRGGRISKTSAAIGGLMNIKPIITVDVAGKLQNVEKIRGRKKALQLVADKISEATTDPANQTIFITTSADQVGAEEVKRHLEENIQPKEVRIFPLGTTISSHTGLGCIAVFTRGEKRN
ncbi:MAG: DegV family protein [Enterococcus viikkiensis]|uniref:DegV family protein n=1 Tax=Enterococcus viikkiensis TaxID=930854 RepID=A0ABU3FRN1_9ENTE|nr:DegV family protein [Enterococcus viikkiensis]MDT2828629.1 DegV family protein [Enterococcus viikkiensis]